MKSPFNNVTVFLFFFSHLLDDCSNGQQFKIFPSIKITC